MSRTKSDNKLLGTLTGNYVSWIHNTGNQTSGVPNTIAHKTGEPFVLLSVIVNTTSSSAITLIDAGDSTHAARVVAVLKASIGEQPMNYNLALIGDLKVDNPGNSDLTITYSNR